MDLSYFKEQDFVTASLEFFAGLEVPVQLIETAALQADDVLKPEYNRPGNGGQKLVNSYYAIGLVTDEIFLTGKNTEETIRFADNDRYDGILLMGVTLQQKENGRDPNRSELAEIARKLNQSYPTKPVVTIFRYGDKLAFANAERSDYKRANEDGEKVGKISLLRDVKLQGTHAGHVKILKNLAVPHIGKNKVETFAGLHEYWRKALDVEVLNKDFYKEISNWYFWANDHVKFPSEPTLEDAHRKKVNLEDLVREHKATNVIRLLTRLLFTWFIKEKKLVPDELFDLGILQEDILNEVSPYHEEGMFKEANKDSIYYKAILQNLFFASFNCPAEADEVDRRARQFRGDESYGKHRGIDWMMRYKKYFKNPDAFLELMNKTVPFLNGGLFECLDDKTQNIYVDGFSDQMTKEEQLVVPDYLFFGATEYVDLSSIRGVKNKETKQAAVKGLINILDSYKFTVTENTPVEEDVALDPELLGKVFENLLASYNPETKTTARKQTGSFYTPREIVNYMVDESLIAYLKNKILEDKSEAFLEFGKSQLGLFGNEFNAGQMTLQETLKGNEFDNNEDKLDELLHQLVSFDSGNPFKGFPRASKAILTAIDECKILDPACGSGAFPMGALQKMVHILQKLDPDNSIWKEVQKNKAKQAADTAYDIEDTGERRERLREIDEAFDRNINEPDYARKLYLIENCIYGVDIQPIATQISKLRFFISLVVDQRKNTGKPNFGIRALPNLETKFVAANTLIGIEKPQAQTSLFDTPEVKELETKLKKIRSKLFSAKTKETKLKYRKKDEELRNAIADELKNNGWPNATAIKLSTWDPYDQNASSFFFDPEWMFDISNGFDVIIGNPPYGALSKPDEKKYFKDNYTTTKTINNIQKGSLDTYTLFIEAGYNFCSLNGNLIYIVPISFTSSDSLTGVHKLLEENCSLIKFSSYSVRPEPIFKNAVVNTSIVHFVKDLQPVRSILSTKMYRKKGVLNLRHLVENISFIDVLGLKIWGRYPKISFPIEKSILKKIHSQDSTVGENIVHFGKPLFYRTTGGRYFKIITNFSTGSTKEKRLLINEKYTNSIGAILSSNLYFWFYQIYSNNLDLKSFEIETFGIPLSRLDSNVVNKLELIYEEYLNDVMRNSDVRRTEKYANIDSFREFKISKSKHIIDKIDDLIGPLYGLTKDEVDFIKNYELSFRLNKHEE